MKKKSLSPLVRPKAQNKFQLLKLNNFIKTLKAKRCMTNVHVQLTQYTWLQVPHETRMELAKIFSIPMSGVRKVEYAAKPIVISDGYTYDDLSTVTVEKMQEYVKSDETDFHKLFDLVLKKVIGGQEVAQLAKDAKVEEQNAVEAAITAQKTVETLAEVSELAKEVLKRKPGRPAKV